jgi:hypothetical protein
VTRTFPHALPKSAGSPPLTRFQNRACVFRLTRLLGSVTLVRRTFDRLILRGLDVMTMPMKELAVGGFALAPVRLGDEVGAFHQVLSMFAVQSTPCAASALPLEQDGPFARRVRMSAPSARPVDPIAVIRAPCARDLRIPTDRRGAMAFQLHPVRCFACPLPVAWVPVLLADPPRRFVRMTAVCPATQVRVECSIHADEGRFGGHRRIIVAPSPADGMETFNAHRLRGGAESSPFLRHLADMSTLPGCRGPDEGLEAQGHSLPGFPCVGVPHGVLPDLEAEEIAPGGAFNRVERMPDPRFTGLQGSSHRLSPPCRHVLRLHNGMRVSGENDQVIGQPANSGLPPVTVLRSGIGVSKRRLQPVQGHMHQEGRQHAPLRGPSFRGKAVLPIHDACLEPGRNGPAQSREGVAGRDKCLVTNPSNAFFKVRIPDIFVLLVAAGMHGLNRLMARASWPEAVAVGRALRLPFRFQSAFRQGLAGAIRQDRNASRPALRCARLGYPNPTPGVSLRA